MKLFCTWFFLGLAILFSGFWCVAALAELLNNGIDMLVATVFVFSGAVLVGLLAVAISKIPGRGKDGRT